MSRALSPEEVVAHLRGRDHNDDEVLDYFRRGHMAIAVNASDNLEWAQGDPSSMYQQRILRDWLGRNVPGNPPTSYAREKIAKIAAEYPVMRRTARNGRVSKEKMATRVGIDRDSISEWVERGWMTWPPDGKNPQN